MGGGGEGETKDKRSENKCVGSMKRESERVRRVRDRLMHVDSVNR